MPILNSGIMPGGALGAEMEFITRRAVIPTLVNQAVNSSPLLAAMMASANDAMGGISSVTVPMQTAPLTTPQWSDFGMNFSQPAYQTGIQNAEFNLKIAITPLSMLGSEFLVQDAHAIIPRIEAVMDSASNDTRNMFATALATNTTNNQAFIGLPGAVDDGTTLATYGGLNRTANAWYQSFVQSQSSNNPTRNSVMANIASVFKRSAEMPTYGILGVGGWTQLAADFIGVNGGTLGATSVAIEQYISDSRDGTGTRSSAFRAIDVAGVPIYCDPTIPEGTLYLNNSKYLSFYLHHQARFNFTGFHSTMPNFQVGYVGAVITAAELVNTKPISCGKFTNYAYASI